MAKDPQVGQETARTSRETISSDILISPRNFCLAGKMGCAISFDGERSAGGAGGARLPARPR
jgi:hypothetical protein